MNYWLNDPSAALYGVAVIFATFVVSVCREGLRKHEWRRRLFTH
jgi:hypothetical protein